MRIFLRFVIFVATVVGVVALLIGGIFLGTGDLGFLERIGITPSLGTIEIAPGTSPDTQEITTTVDSEAVGSEAILRFTWSGEEIVYNDTVISDIEFAELLTSAEANEAKVEVIKFSDVRVEIADRWREMLDASGVRYEVIPVE